MEKRSIIIMLIISGLFSGLHTASAYIASSTNYRLERDSINFSGTRSTSSNYLAEDTLGEVGTGRGTSTNYRVEAGYQQAVSQLLQEAAKCQPVPVTLKNQTVRLIAVDCLQGASQQQANPTILQNSSLS